MAILRRNRASQSRWETLIFFAILPHCPACNEVLQLLISSKPQHFLASTGSVAGPKVLVHDIEKLLKLKGRTSGEDRNQLFSYQIGNSTGKCIFL